MRYKTPSLEEPPSILMTCASADERLLRRFNGLLFDKGDCTPFSSKVCSVGFFAFKSIYLIRLLFVSAMKSLPFPASTSPDG